MGDVIRWAPEPAADGRRGLENATVRLLKRRPFYGHLLLGFQRQQVAEGPPVGATIRNGLPVLTFYPDAFARFTPDEQGALLEHALKHILHLHPLRRGGVHRLTWDAACDLAINPTIAHLPAEAARPEQFELEDGLAAEEYYRELSRPFDAGNLPGEGVGRGERDTGAATGAGPDSDAAGGVLSVDFKTLDDHKVWDDADSTPVALGEEVVRDLVRVAHRRSRGEIPGDLVELVESLLAPAPIPWPQVLRQFVTAAGRVGRKSTWKREHRRFGRTTPGVRKRQRLNLLVAVDVSESTDQRPLREAFARELLRIARGRDSLLTVLYAGSRIQRIESFTSSTAVAEVYRGRGFTDLRPVFDHARQMQSRPAAVIYLTDGYGEAPEAMEFPTLWVLTKDGRKPANWGVELRLEE